MKRSQVLVVEANAIINDIEAVHDQSPVPSLMGEVVGGHQPDANRMIAEAVLMLLDCIDGIRDSLVKRHHCLALGKLQPIHQTFDVRLHY
ncbi:hypothetical protein WA852_23490 [Pseudomonas aeruginosa]